MSCVFNMGMGLGMIGTDLEILYGRWLIGWLPIVKQTILVQGVGWLIDNGGRLQHYYLHCIKINGGG